MMLETTTTTPRQIQRTVRCTALADQPLRESRVLSDL
jgi:hypothetical protein